MAVPLSLLDLAPVNLTAGETLADSIKHSVTMAQNAEAGGYERIWYAEHHNMPTIASAAPAVLTGIIAAQTSTIRLGAGGVMLPNHAPLTIAEQFTTLAAAHPGRIDLGLGRAPGTDQQTFAALRRNVASAERFPSDVVELQAYLRGESRIAGVSSLTGQPTDVELYILGSSLFGAQLAAQLGLPYAFASHFAPQALDQAITIYRNEFRPSDALAEPYLIAGMTAIVADDPDVAEDQRQKVVHSRVRRQLPADRVYSDEEIDALLSTPGGASIADMMRYSAVGTPDVARAAIEDFAAYTNADELIIAPTALDRAIWHNTVTALAPSAPEVSASGLHRETAAS
ncbi:LLM class flavin-dependent oxidoreductase [Gordonia sp. CPCC 205333]|uniref:LLM class flavin-dependent oxidoreductase n=1 Tax=Gordonia sp. CPCC 205333 TaxID=3140790 RepID=UPI003AF3F187